MQGQFCNKCFEKQQFNSRGKCTYLGWDELTFKLQELNNHAHRFLTIPHRVTEFSTVYNAIDNFI